MKLGLTIDLDHPGLNNKFHKTFKTYICKQFNSNSVLEHHHFSQAVEIIHRKECNILNNYDGDDIEEIKQLLKSAIVATDLSMHKASIDGMHHFNINTRNQFKSRKCAHVFRTRRRNGY